MLDQLQDKITAVLQNTSVWTVTSATMGGVYKTLVQHKILLNSVSVDGSISVMTYAFLSAAVGYCTKKALDYLFSKFKKK